MTVTVSVTANSLAKPLENLRNSIAYSSTFQTVVGEANETDAKTHIFYYEADESNADHAMPRCIIDYADNEEREQLGFTGNSTSGTLIAYFEFLTNASYTHRSEDAGLDFDNNIGAIVKEMQAAQGSDPSGYLDIASITVDTGNRGPSKKKDHNGIGFYGCPVLVTWNGMR